MRLIKKLGFAMLASVIAMAFFGTSSTMAALDSEIVVCGENAELCPSGKILSANANITANSTKAPVFLGLLKEECEKSSTTGSITNAGGMGASLLIQFTSLLFEGNCKPCSTTLATAGVGHITMGSDVLWTVVILNVLAFLHCPLGILCHYEVGSITLDALNIAEGTLLLAEKDNIPVLKDENGFCGKGLEWDGHYVIKNHWLSTFKL